MGARLYFAGYDLSGDISAITKLSGGPALMEAPGISDSAMFRLPGKRSGEIGMNSWFNPSSAQEHAAFSPRTTGDLITILAMSQTIGDVAACLNGLQVNYDPTLAQNGSLSEAIQILSDGKPLHWGNMVTAGKRTDTAATNGAWVDLGAANTAAVTITSASAANPTSVLTATAHGLATGDSVTISGTNKAALNADWQVTVVDATHFTVPCDLSGGAASGGSMQKTSYANGLSLYHQIFSFTGTSITTKIQHSADAGVVDTAADITGATTAALTAVGGVVAETATGVIVRRYVRAVSVGTFNPCTFATAVCRHPVAGTI